MIWKFEKQELNLVSIPSLFTMQGLNRVGGPKSNIDRQLGQRSRSANFGGQYQCSQV